MSSKKIVILNEVNYLKGEILRLRIRMTSKIKKEEEKMKTNKTVSYAVACLKELARQWGEFVQVMEIARNQAIPAAYCQKILLALSRSGIVESVKGKGFMLLKPMEEITTLEVVNALSSNDAVEEEENDTLRLINKVLATKLNRALAELSVAEIVTEPTASIG